ncbi:prion-inhibition and propagation-domain-containing protein [Xylariomycetidae sp. FL0641]|nr:prion-inhibition and propagation-domain-containing protein [Xylariomycetidae sp. FL0641]
MVDALSALGLGIGAVSLVLQITDECIKRYKYFTEACQMPESYQYLRVRIQIEQQRFLNFAVEAGLLVADGTICDSLRVNQGVLKAVLMEIKCLFESYEEANGKYVDSMPQSPIDWNEPEEPQTELLEKLSITHRRVTGQMLTPAVDQSKTDSWDDALVRIGEFLSRKTRKLRTIFTDPKRLVWVNADRSSFEGLISRLADLNSFLIALLDSSQISRLEREMEKTYLEILHLRKDVKSLEVLIQALRQERMETHTLATSPYISAGFGVTDGVMAEKLSDTRSREQLKTLTTIKIRRLEVDDQEHLRAHHSFQHSLRLEIPCTDLVEMDATGGSIEGRTKRTSMCWQGHDAWIEWMSTTKRPQHDSLATDPTEHRINLLVRLLQEEKPTEFRAPPCLGYIKSPIAHRDPFKCGTRFGIVYARPTTGAPASNLVTLRELLGQKPKPSLTARISLCSALAECLGSFHAVDWLHKGLRSDNVLFFTQPAAGTTTDARTRSPTTAPASSSSSSSYPDLSAPYVTGLGLSRPGADPELTAKPPACDPATDLYRHPRAQGGEAASSSAAASSYREAYDLYSLGVLLLEVAAWRPVEALLGLGPEDVRALGPEQLRGVQGLLLGEAGYLDRAARRCGDAFRDVVERCLGADAVARPAYRGEAAAAADARLRTMYREAVVPRLRALREALKGAE